MQEAEPFFDSEDLFEHYKKKNDFYETKEKAHGEIEHRQYYLVRPSKHKTWSIGKASRLLSVVSKQCFRHLEIKVQDPCFIDGHLMDKGWYSGLRKEEYF